MADGGDVAYSFPLLTSKKIVGHLWNMNIQISEEVCCTCFTMQTLCKRVVVWSMCKEGLAIPSSVERGRGE